MATDQRVPQAVWQYTMQFPLEVDSLALAANAAETWTCPQDTDFVLIVPTTTPLYIREASAATVISGDVTDGTSSMPITGSSMFRVSRGVAYSFICGATCLVGIGRYKK
jgi:hypothetical protein